MFSQRSLRMASGRAFATPRENQIHPVRYCVEPVDSLYGHRTELAYRSAGLKRACPSAAADDELLMPSRSHRNFGQRLLGKNFFGRQKTMTRPLLIAPTQESFQSRPVVLDPIWPQLPGWRH
jgi:hypothetical protein